MSRGGAARDAAFGPYTVRDLEALPEDGKGFELEDGWLINLSPSLWHNWAARRLGSLIEADADRADASVFVCYGGDWEVTTPTGVRKPDVFGVPLELAVDGIEERTLAQLPGRELLFVAEIVSPGSSSERTDRVRKVAEYAALGIPQYWIIDLDPHPVIQVLTLAGDIYQVSQVVEAGSTFAVQIEADKPFLVSFDPATLAQAKKR